MANYAEYLQTTGLKVRQDLAASSAENTDALIQMLRNQSAPSIMGSGSYGGGTSSISTANLTLPSLKGGKTLPVGGRVSQNWGKSNIKYAAGRHTGMDFGVGSGSRVGAAAAGVVVRAGREGAYGNAIHVRHKDGTTTLYAHLSQIGVKAGQTVKAGQQIARSGNTGRSFGAHLHFEVRTVDKYGGDVNPRSWLSTR